LRVLALALIAIQKASQIVQETPFNISIFFKKYHDLMLISSLNEKRTGEFLFDGDDEDLLNDPEIGDKGCKANKRIKKL
jgi:hypothetical protein